MINLVALEISLGRWPMVDIAFLSKVFFHEWYTKIHVKLESTLSCRHDTPSDHNEMCVLTSVVATTDDPLELFSGCCSRTQIRSSNNQLA